MQIVRPVMDLLKYWRSRDLRNYVWFLPFFVVIVVLFAALQFWSLPILIPLLVGYGYVFQFDRILRPFG